MLKRRAAAYRRTITRGPTTPDERMLLFSYVLWPTPELLAAQLEEDQQRQEARANG
jgi:hypothetical protein